MKSILVLLLTLFICSLAPAQLQVIANDSSYATTDTTATVIVPSGDLVLSMWFKDSVNVSIAVDYKSTNSSVWATYNAEADSTNSTTAGGLYKGYLLRRGSTNNIPGAMRLRLRVTPKTTKNGVTSPTYDAMLTRD